MVSCGGTTAGKEGVAGGQANAGGFAGRTLAPGAVGGITDPAGATGGVGSGGTGAGGAAPGGAAGSSPPVCEVISNAHCGDGYPSSVCLDCSHAGVVTHYCQSGSVQSNASSCGPHRCVREPAPGADDDCLPEELCVQHLRANLQPMRMECVPNPCEPGVVDPTCAGTAVCPAAHRWWVNSDGGGISLACVDWPPDCPASLPSAGDSCPLDTMQCLYQDCADYGVADVRCAAGAWTVELAACTDFDCAWDLTCAAGEICSVAGPYFAPRGYCGPTPTEPGLVAGPIGFQLTCDNSESAGIEGGGITTTCSCATESPYGC